MKKCFIILICFTSFILSQDRSIIFNTGSPDSLDFGYEISSNQSIANKFTIMNDYVLEAMVFYVTLQSQFGSINVSIREDNDGTPGETVSELANWIYTLEPSTLTGYNLITTTDLCIYLEAGSNYWWTMEAADESTQALWIHSNVFGYNYSVFDADTNEWTTNAGYAGAGGIWAEQIYEPPFNDGDVNFDFATNVVDIVLIVGHILDTNILDDDAVQYADLNSDGTIDVVDLVQLINMILTEQSSNPDFVLEDINPSSEYYGQEIGPSFFNGQVSAYYFGKQGWSMCRARFGIINDLYNDLLSEGITDVKIMGINGYQYIDDNIDCMICADTCSSSTCDSGPRILPWAQDQDDGLNCQGQNQDVCSGGDDVSDIWDAWNIVLRDFVILDRNGIEFARVNLTYNNPDPSELGECSGNYQKIKDLIQAARNR